MNYESIIDPIDVSENQDGSVLAYVQNDTTSDRYIMIIATPAPVLYANKDSSNMFERLNYLTTINNLTSLNTSRVTDMYSMFYNCYSLTSLDLSSFDTSNVTRMSEMFAKCSSLTSLDLSSFDTSNVTTMSYMFYDCSSLTSLNLSSFDTSKVTNMNGMFRVCSSLTTIYASELWDTSKVTSSKDMFDGTINLRGAVSYNSSKLDVSMANYTTGYLTYKAHN